MSRRLWRHRCAVGVSLLILSLLVWPATIVVQTQSGNRYSGQATGLRATKLNLPAIVISDTGPLPPEGGALEKSLLEVSIPGNSTGGILALNAEVFHSSAIGMGNQSRSEASLASLDLNVAGNRISAAFLRAFAVAACDGTRPVLSGNSELVNLTINGQPVTVTEPNQRIDLPTGGYVALNEQRPSTRGNYGEVTVNALHVVIPGVADVVVASAHADIDCQGPPPCPDSRDFVTGGGWIQGTPSGAKGTFAVAGGVKNGGLWGHLTYIDHGSRLKVKGTAVTSYVIDPASTRRYITGTAEINGASETYEVWVTDNGEPGRNDTFMIRLSNLYAAGGTLQGGNIQLHKSCPGGR